MIIKESEVIDMMNNYVVDFGTMKTWNEDEARNLCNFARNNIFKDNYESHKISITVNSIKDGYINTSDIYVFDSYVDALETINSYEYSDKAVEVNEIGCDHYTHLMWKSSDTYNYSRLAQPKTKWFNLSFMRNLFDTRAKVYFNID